LQDWLDPSNSNTNQLNGIENSCNAIQGTSIYTAAFGRIYVSANDSNWYYIYDKGIWVYTNSGQDLCSDNVWFYTSSDICGYTGWFYTSGTDWVSSNEGGWLYWTGCFSGNKIDNGESRLIDISVSPNPFSNTTTISYHLPEDSPINIAVYDAMGKQVAILENTHQLVGSYQQPFDASNLPIGIYYIKIHAGEFSKIEKVVIAR